MTPAKAVAISHLVMSSSVRPILNPQAETQVPFLSCLPYGPAAFLPGFAMSDFLVRPARPDEAGLILSLLSELAAYEKLPITITEEDIAFDFFGLRPLIECELAFEGDVPVGLVTYYWTYATFRAARRLYLEDLFVLPSRRGKGYGKALLAHLAKKGLAAGAARLEWQVLDWNAPAIHFYQSIGAHPHEGWFTYWLEGDALKRLGSD
jgi:diamine N-acetyltransferase